MDRDTAKYEIQRRAKELLQPDNSKQGFICPICGSGSGKKGTGITTKDGIHFTCWAGCFSNADIIDIIERKLSIQEKLANRGPSTVQTYTGTGAKVTKHNTSGGFFSEV